MLKNMTQCTLCPAIFPLQQIIEQTHSQHCGRPTGKHGLLFLL